MIDPDLKRFAEGPEKLPLDSIFWFATAAGIFVGHPVTYDQMVKITAFEEQESEGDFRNIIDEDRNKMEIRPYTEDEKQSPPPLKFLILDPILKTTNNIFRMDHATLYVDKIIAWGVGNPYVL